MSLCKLIDFSELTKNRQESKQGGKNSRITKNQTLRMYSVDQLSQGRKAYPNDFLRFQE